MIDRLKCFKLYLLLELPAEVPFIVNLWHVSFRTWTYIAPECRFCQMKLYVIHNYCTTEKSLKQFENIYILDICKVLLCSCSRIIRLQLWPLILLKASVYGLNIYNRLFLSLLIYIYIHVYIIYIYIIYIYIYILYIYVYYRHVKNLSNY